jgi:hypothetical protein
MLRIGLLAFCLLTAAGPAVGEEPVAESAPEEIVERIVELRRELDALLASLPAELRDEVERRLSQERGEAVVALPPPAEVEVDTTVPEVVAAPEPAPAAESECAALAVFDSNEDGFVSGLDRYWRYFKLWLDDGDGDIEEPELASLYDSGIAQISARLTHHTTVDGGSGDVWVEEGVVVVDVPGRNSRSAVLLIDADRLARGGEMHLVAVDGAALTGFHAVGEAVVVALAGDELRPLLCP